MPTRIFLSYGRSDDHPNFYDPQKSFMRRLYNELKMAGFEVWWDRENMPSRGRTFLQEIRDAITDSDKVLLVVGKKAIESKYVRAEWKYAQEICKNVVPILRNGTFKIIPPKYALLNCPDFSDLSLFDHKLAELVRILNEDTAPLGNLTDIPELPKPFLPRPKDIAKLHKLINADTVAPTIITSERKTTVLEGMGGIGKSVLAAEFARDCTIRRVFSDGIIHLRAAQTSTVLLYQQLGVALGDNKTNYPIDEYTCKVRVQNILNNKRCLIILDDVWKIEISDNFRDLIAGTSARLLITSRNLQISNSLGTNELRLGLPNEPQSVAYLRKWVRNDDPDLANVAKRLDYLPLALTLAGARMKKGLSGAEYVEKFDLVSNITAFADADKDNPKYSLEASIELGMNAVFGEKNEEIKKQKRLLYFTFGIFPEDVKVPHKVILRLWQKLRPDINKFDLEEILNKLVDLALVERRNDDKTITLHDLLHSYTKENLGDQQQQIQRTFLASYKESDASWHQVEDDNYIFQHLIFHLLQANDFNAIKIIGEHISEYAHFKLGPLMISELSSHYSTYKNELHPILTGWLKQGNPSTELPQIVAGIAVNCEIEDILKNLLEYPNEKIQYFVIQDSYRIWQKNPTLIKSLLTHLVSSITLLKLRHSAQTVNILLRCSIFIGLYDQLSPTPNPETVPFLLNIWRVIFDKFFLISNVKAVELGLKWIRKQIIRIAVSVLMGVMQNLPDASTQMIFSLPDISAFFPPNEDRKKIVHTLLGHLDAVMNKSPNSLEELLAFIRTLAYQGDRDSISAYIGLAALLMHGFREPIRTVQLASKLLEELDNYYPAKKDKLDFTATIWYTVIGFVFSNISIRDLSPEDALTVLSTLLERRYVWEERYDTSFQFPSGTVYRGNTCIDTIWGYELKMSDVGSKRLKTYLDLLIKRQDFEQINNSVYALIEGIEFYSFPRAAFDALPDALKILQPYLTTIDAASREEFWRKFTETLTTYGSRHKDYLDEFLKKYSSALLPQEVTKQLSNVVPSENFNRIFVVVLVLFVRKVLEDEKSPVRELIKWGFSQIPEARSMDNLILRWIAKISDVVYGQSIIGDIK